MKKTYLPAGAQLRLNGAVARVGASGTVVDLALDWSGTVDYCGNNPNAPGIALGIGTVLDEDLLTYDVFIDVPTGRLWFDNDRGY